MVSFILFIFQNIWRDLYGALEVIATFLGVTRKAPVIEAVSIDKFSTWFEVNLSKIIYHDLGSIRAELNNLDDCSSSLQRYIAEFRTASTSLTGPQLNRANKFCDQVDAFTNLFGPPSQSQLRQERLPDFDFVRDIIAKMRNKLKVLEEMAASAKLQKVDFASGGNVAAIIRNILHNMQMSIDRLEYHSQKQSKVLNYLVTIKQTVRRPIASFQQKLSEVVTLRDGTSIAEAKLALREVDLKCRALKKAPEHARVSKLQKEIQMIEGVVGDMVKPIRDIVQLMNATGTATGKQQQQQQASSSNAQQQQQQQQQQSSGARSTEWAKTLRGLLAGADSDLLERCKNEHTMQLFASAVFELRTALKTPSKSKRRPSWPNNANESDTFGVETFDLEFFAAYLQDWSERKNSIVSVLANKAYNEEKKALLASLETLKQRKQEHERSESRKKELQTLIDDLTVKFDDVDKLLNEVCQSELRKSVELVLPKDSPLELCTMH